MDAQLATPPAAPAGAAAAAIPPAAPDPAWTLHTQATWIDQGHPTFDSPYEGPNSLTGAAESDRTFSFSLFAGFRIWQGLDIYFNPEFFQGHGLSNTLGMAGFPNGEAVKAAFPNLHYNTSRLYLQQTFGLGGETERQDDGPNQVASTVDVNRITLSVGKFAASDFFDANTYSHDTRSQFMNWALWESAAWDYPADIVGYTAGFVAEWNTKDWTLNYGIFMEPTESNGAVLDKHLLDAHGQILEFDRRYGVGDLTGTLRPFVFWNQARMGNYSDALAEPSIADALIETRAYRSKVGFGVSWDQELTKDLGAFVRLSWDDGRTESFAFTEVDRSAAVGLSMDGVNWGRKDDTLGVAEVVNAIVPEHQAYLAAGGTQGLILGDGALSYEPEEILETYYSIHVAKWLMISPDFQYALNPGYNRDRGPVAIYAVRVHAEF
jgi:high affinity Mn2+ porin